jgi:5-formyltetrahydrofolate cyclo-ligase
LNPDSAVDRLAAIDKAALRRQLKRARDAVDRAARRAAARRALRRALANGLLLRGQRFGFYLPHKGEFDILPILNQALWMGRACYLPVVPARGRVLRFALVHGRNPMTTNRYGIPEPWDARPIAARQLDVLFVPLVGFDPHGNRLGMGGGYYDATLAYLANRRQWRKPRLIGVGYECQRVTALPRDAWDAPLDAVLTERAYYRFSNAAAGA